MQVLVREGTAAKNLESLVAAVTAANHPFFSFCTDDREPQDIVEEGHIDYLIKKAIKLGLDPIIALKMATINTARHYNLRSMGAIAPGYKADMVVIDNLQSFTIRTVIKDSQVIAEGGQVTAPLTGTHNNPPDMLGTLTLAPYSLDTFRIPAVSDRIQVIGIREGDLYTDTLTLKARVEQGEAVADPERDLAKVVIFDRHRGKSTARAFARGFGIRQGAIATTIGHDSHNLAVLGMADADMLLAAREVENMHGGISVVVEGELLASVPLPIAGLISNRELESVIAQLTSLKGAIRKMGTEKDILMILHFIQLAVIPEIKVTDQGLVNVLKQEFIDLFV
jgi:adenine deaminase